MIYLIVHAVEIYGVEILKAFHTVEDARKNLEQIQTEVKDPDNYYLEAVEIK